MICDNTYTQLIETTVKVSEIVHRTTIQRMRSMKLYVGKQDEEYVEGKVFGEVCSDLEQQQVSHQSKTTISD